MIRRSICTIAAVSCFVICNAALTIAQDACEKLRQLRLPEVTITSATNVQAGPFELPPGMPAKSVDVPAFCRVQATLKPSSDSDIAIEVWLPISGWNGKLQQIGNGGLAGSINLLVLAQKLKQGFAAAATDDGHKGMPTDGSWAIGHPEKLKDFGYRAVHETNVNAKKIIEAFYQKSPRFSYFNGCSEGGREALMEAQRFPQDFDGILAGAPAHYWTELMASFAWNAQALDNSASFIPEPKRRAIEDAVIAACGKQDGVADNFVEDPLRCSFDPSTLWCKGSDSDRCLTAQQLDALKKIYQGPKNPRTGQLISPGYEPGAEAEPGVPGISFASYVFGAAPGFSLDAMFSSAVYGGFVFEDPKWKFSDLNFDKDITKAQEKIGAVLDASNPDLSAFRARGGKMIQYHGWNDGSPVPLHSVNYYKEVAARMGGIEKTQQFYRLYMVPGMMHCGQGAGPNLFGNVLDFSPADDPNHNIFLTLQQWVEDGVSPSSIIATKKKDNDPAKETEMTRPLCSYPATAKWNSKGSVSDAANWHCESPQ